ncbi:MAG: efflux transporter outer membrane subunit, partial [Pseudomonadales bacterium]|nr:efflux transporter outer membrane subunit [Pseudomonadales bacterium]
MGPDFKAPARLSDQHPMTRAGFPSATDAGAPVQHWDSSHDLTTPWWESWGSPHLNALVKMAFTHNPTLQSAEAALRQAHENTAAQFSSYFPSLQAGYSPSRQSISNSLASPLNVPTNPFNLQTAQLSISYMPDVFGLNHRWVESLQAQEAIQRDQLDAAHLTLASSLVAAAVQEAALRAQIQATQAAQDDLVKLLKITTEAQHLGDATGLDVLSEQTVLAQWQQTLPPLEKQLEQTRDLIAVLTGRRPDENQDDDFNWGELTGSTTVPVGLPSQLVRNRPDVRAAEEQVHAASALVGVAVANRFPQFSLTAAYGGSATQWSNMFSQNNAFWIFSGSATMSLFDFGGLRHRQHAAEAALDQTQAQYRAVVLQAFQGVADALYAADSDAMLEAASRKVENAALASY